jgi:hypothetical protein
MSTWAEALSHPPRVLGALLVLAAACSSSNTVIWNGTTEASGADSVPTRLDLSDSSGSVTGTVYVTFPDAGAPIQAATLTGVWSGNRLQLSSPIGVSMDLTRSGSALSGTVTFAVEPDGGAPIVGSLQVSR